MFAELLASVERKIEEEKAGIYTKFAAKKTDLNKELEDKLTKDTATIREVEKMKASTAKKLKASKAVMDDAIKSFKKASDQIQVAKEHEAKAKLDNERVRVLETAVWSSGGGWGGYRLGCLLLCFVRWPLTD